MIFNYAPEPRGLGRSWFRFPFLPDSDFNRERRAKMNLDVERYRTAPKPVHLTTGEPTKPERSWRERLSSWLHPLDAYVDVHDQSDFNPAAIKQARLYPWLRFFHRTDPALDRLARANRVQPDLAAQRAANAVAYENHLRNEEVRWQAVADAARSQNRARAALLKPRIGTPR